MLLTEICDRIDGLDGNNPDQAECREIAKLFHELSHQSRKDYGKAWAHLQSSDLKKFFDVLQFIQLLTVNLFRDETLPTWEESLEYRKSYIEHTRQKRQAKREAEAAAAAANKE